MFAAAVRASEQGVLAVERDWADSALDDVGIDLDAAVGNEARQPVPTRQRISDGLREFGLLANQTKLGAQPGSNSSAIGRLFSWRTARRSSAVRPRISASMT